MTSPSVTLEFGGDGTNPPVFVKDSIQKDWKTKKDIIDNIFNAMLKDDQLTNKIRKYFYYQSNYGKPTFVIKPYPSTDSLPKVVWKFTGDEIINITRSRTKFTVDIVDGYWLNEGDVVYIDTSEEDIRGYYIIPEIIYNVSKNSIITTLVLDYVTRYS
jgi:hypothetical protein